MSRRRESNLNNLAEIMEGLSQSGFSREQIIQQLDRFFPQQEASNTPPQPPTEEFAGLDLSEGNSGQGGVEYGQASEEESKVSAEEERGRNGAGTGEKKSDSSPDSSISPGAERGTKKGGRYSIGGTASTSATRGRTQVGPQVEHSSAYVLYEELAYQAIEGKTAREIPQSLQDNFGSLPLNEQAMNKIQTIAQNAQEPIPRQERKEVTRTLRGANLIFKAKDYLKNLISRTKSATEQDTTTSRTESEAKEELDHLEEVNEGLDRITQEIDIEPVKQSIRLGNRAALTPFVKEIMDECIFGANKMPHASLPNEGVPENPNTGQEKTAKNNLRLLSDFIEDIAEMRSNVGTGNIEAAAKLLEELESYERPLQTKWGITTEQTQSIINDISLDEVLFPIVQDQISQHMGELFYYPHLEQTHRYAMEEGGLEQDWSVTKEEWQQVMSKDKYNQGTRPRSNDPEIMYEVAGRHIVLVMNCFKGLSGFDQENQRGIVSLFLEDSILERQGWNQEIGLRDLENRVDDLAKLDYEKGVFFTKNSSRGVAEDLAKSSIEEGLGR